MTSVRPFRRSRAGRISIVGRQRTPRRGTPAAAGIVALGLALCALPRGIAETVRPIDGDPIDGALVSVTAEHVVVKAGQRTVTVPLGKVVAVDFDPGEPRSLMAEAGRRVAVTQNGGRIGLAEFTVAKGKLEGRTEFAGPVSLPVQSIARLLLPGRHEPPADVEAAIGTLNLKPGDQDVIVVQAAGGVPGTVPGIVLRVTASQIVVDYDGIESPMPLDRVRAIQMARPPAGKTPPAAPVGEIAFLDGSRLGVQSLSGAGADLALEAPDLGRLNVARRQIARIQFRNEQLVPLSDLDPRVEQTPFFDEEFPWRRNRAVNGGPLKVAGRVYEKGLGLHARCRLAFPLAGQYRHFRALAGIDDSVRMGAARLTVRVDAKPAAEFELDRGRPPRALDLDVTGARELVVLADFVAGTMGSGARVDLCDAVLRK